MGGMIEQMVYLDNMSNGIKVGNNQLPKIYKRFRIIFFLPAVFLLYNCCISKRKNLLRGEQPFGSKNNLGASRLIR